MIYSGIWGRTLYDRNDTPYTSRAFVTRRSQDQQISVFS